VSFVRIAIAYTGKPDDADNSASEAEEESDDGDATDHEAPPEVDIQDLVVGMRVKLRDGNDQVFGSTVLLDLEPKPAESFPGARGDYVMVRGGKVKAGSKKTSAMQTVTGWEKTILFVKPKGKKVTINKYPGVLKDDWTFFNDSMSCGDLMKLDQFLIDRQHTWIKPLPEKKTKIPKKPKPTPK
jgi:hypothetical protein